MYELGQIDPGQQPGVENANGLVSNEIAQSAGKIDEPYIPIDILLDQAKPADARQVFEAVITSSYYALEERLLTDSEPTGLELEVGVFLEEIQPQAREAVLMLKEKGYEIGNVLHAGYRAEEYDVQSMTFNSDLNEAELTNLEENGFIIENGQLLFIPEDPTDIEAITQTWDWLALSLPDRGTPAGPALFNNAVAFREAAANKTLMSFYMPDGNLDMVGTKYVRDRDPNADSELFLSSDIGSVVRELIFIDQYHELQARLASDPTATAEELNMGAYKEELEPQVRDAILTMRRKGYNTGSSGFWGSDHVLQLMDMNTSIDKISLTSLAQQNINVSDAGAISFRPENPEDIESITAKWNMIADILPDLGIHADPAQSSSAAVFRSAMNRECYDAYMEAWIWQTGALTGGMQPLTMTMLHEGYSFGEDVYEPARAAEAKFRDLESAT
jgi:hypothetical protein